MSKINFQLGTDAKDFHSGLAAAQKRGQAFGDAMTDVGKKLERNFGAGDVFKGLLQGVGIGSVEKIAEILSQQFKEAAESAKSIAESTAKTLGIYEKLFSSRRTDSQNLEANARQQARLQKELKTTGETREMKRQFNAFTQQFSDVETVTKAANPERAAKIAEELAELATEEFNLKKKIGEEAKKTGEAETKKLKDLTERRDKLRKDELDFAREREGVEEQIDALVYDRFALEQLLVDGAVDVLDAREKSLEIEKKLYALTTKLNADRKRAEDERLRNVEQIKAAEERIAEARKKVATAQTDINNARTDPLRFTLGEAAAGERGSFRSQRNAREIMTKEKQAAQILDRNNLEYDESGKIKYVPQKGESAASIKEKQRIAETQTAPRLNALIGGAEGLRKSTANLDRKEQDPTRAQRDALKSALDESTRLQEIKTVLEGKFTNQ